MGPLRGSSACSWDVGAKNADVARPWLGDALIDSMTRAGGAEILTGAANGSPAGRGTVQELNQLLKQFVQMKKVMKLGPGGPGRCRGSGSPLALSGSWAIVRAFPAWIEPQVSSRVLKIRLRRMGSRQNPFYRIVVSDSRSTRGSSFVEPELRHPAIEPQDGQDRRREGRA
jgi:hypothetical protein